MMYETLIAMCICDLILDNRPNYHIWNFEKFQFQILKPLWFSCAGFQPHQIAILYNWNNLIASSYFVAISTS